MTTLSNELKGVISRRLEIAGSREILTIASALCADEPALIDTRQVSTADVPRFEILDDDQVCDHSTGLIWTRKDVSSDTLNFKDAQAACEKLRFGGSTGWRLPTIKELLSLVDYERHNPAIDTSALTCQSSWYWSSTPLHSSPGDYAWFVSFVDGGSYWYVRYDVGWVRGVRVGQF